MILDLQVAAVSISDFLENILKVDIKIYFLFNHIIFRHLASFGYFLRELKSGLCFDKSSIIDSTAYQCIIYTSNKISLYEIWSKLQEQTLFFLVHVIFTVVFLLTKSKKEFSNNKILAA
ncbi:hypothetical protein RF11_02878 [Thelohanellus kitauei]|uniref:Uncharacterized protein n=1 Tax=Thelohanellus kitauei TaxID=669202 RepID=A0A0C2MID1_THEKT|nr:hypothetical protein RF11_02878 [Thelohanellus kitauei]